MRQRESRSGDTNGRAGSALSRSQSIERAALILTCFTAAEPHLKLGDLAAKLGLNPSTVYRYVATLEAAGLLARDRRHGGYRLGLRIIELAGIALNQIEVRKQAVDEMDNLCRDVNLLVNLGILIEGDVLHIEHAAPREVPRMFTALGRRAVAHCTALGKVLLAHRPWPEVRQIVEQHGWRPYTAQSIRDFDQLEAALAEVCERGYALDCEERRRGITCIATPIRDYTGEVVAALSVSGSTHRLTSDERERIVPLVLQTADRISLRLGYRGDDSFA